MNTEVQDSNFQSLIVINMNGQKLDGYSVIAVNPKAFVSAVPIRLSYETDSPNNLREPHCKAFEAKDVIRMRFSQGQIWDEFDVEPDEACRILGFDVRKIK